MNAATPGASDAPSVFVSYWRPDRRTVLELAGALERVGIDAKGDWLLAASAPYNEVLAEWIAGTSAFVFILTPESLASAECMKELDRAREWDKRIAPVLLRRVDVAAVRKDLQAIHWIDFTNDTTADAVAKLLREGIDKDFEWEREHNRLIGRARHWERSGRKRALTLRGEDLRAAEAWMARATANPTLSPRPNDQIIDFIAQSRRDEKRTQRTLYTVIIAVLLLILGAAVFSLSASRARAQSEAARAEEARRRAVATREAVDARNARLVAENEKVQAQKVEAEQRAEAARQKMSAAINAENALRELLQRTEERGRQLLNVGDVSSATPYLAKVYAERTRNPRLGDTAGLRLMLARAVAPLRGRRAVLTEGTGIETIVFGPGESRIATTNDDGELTIWDAATGKAIFGKEPESKSKMIGAAFSPDGRRLLAYQSVFEGSDGTARSSYKRRIHLLDTASWSELEQYDENESHSDPGDVEFEPPLFTADGRGFAFAFRVQSGKRFSWEDGSELETRPIDAPPARRVSDGRSRRRPCPGIVAEPHWRSSDGTLILDRSGAIYRTADCAWLTFLEGTTLIRSAAFTKDNRLVLAAYGDGAILWEWRQSRPSLRAELTSCGTDAVFTDVSSRTILVSGAEVIMPVRLPGSGIEVETFREAGASLIPMSRRAVVAREDGIHLKNTRDGESLAKLQSREGAAELWQADAASGLMLVTYPSEFDGSLHTTPFELRRLDTGEQRGSMSALGESYDALAMNWRGRRVFTASKDGYNASLWVSGMRDWNPEYFDDDNSGYERLTAAAYMPDGETILAVGGDRKARFYPGGAGEMKTRLADASTIVISADGRFAVTSNADSSEILDLEELLSVGSCTGTTSGDRWAISADSRFVVTAGPDAAARIYELRSGRLLATMPLRGLPSAPVRFNAKGDEILVQAGGVTQIWHVAPESRPAAEIEAEVRRLLPLRLAGERLVPNDGR